MVKAIAGLFGRAKVLAVPVGQIHSGVTPRVNLCQDQHAEFGEQSRTVGFIGIGGAIGSGKACRRGGRRQRSTPEVVIHLGGRPFRQAIDQTEAEHGQAKRTGTQEENGLSQTGDLLR